MNHKFNRIHLFHAIQTRFESKNDSSHNSYHSKTELYRTIYIMNRTMDNLKKRKSNKSHGSP